eukprot:273817-Rhodomonas_salina.3
MQPPAPPAWLPLTDQLWPVICRLDQADSPSKLSCRVAINHRYRLNHCAARNKQPAPAQARGVAIH